MGRAGAAGRGAGHRRPCLPELQPALGRRSWGRYLGAGSGGTQDDSPGNRAAVAGGCAKTEGWGDDGIGRRGEGSGLAGPDRNLGGGSLKGCASGSAQARKTGGRQRERCLGRSGGASSGVTLSQMGRGLTPGPGSHACWM